MKKSVAKFIEDILRDYPEIDQYLKERNQSIFYPFNERDENVGGGKAQNKKNESTAITAITIAEDRRLFQLRKQKEAVEKCLNRCDKDTRLIIDNLYFKKHVVYTIDGIAYLLNSSHASVSRKKKSFIKDVAIELGIGE